MKVYDATEQAYKNGYSAGRRSVVGGELVSVVRCKKCRHYDEDGEYCGFWGGCRHPEHFCNEGENNEQ